MDEDFFLALFIGWLDLFIGEHDREANCDDCGFAVDLFDLGAIHFDCECGNGGFNDFINTRRNDGILGRYWQLLVDLIDKLPCQYKCSWCKIGLWI